MRIEDMRIGMTLFVAEFSSATETITVYRGTVSELVVTGCENNKKTVVLLWDEREDKDTGLTVFDPDHAEVNASAAIENFYVRMMLLLRTASAATRKAEWLFRFGKLNNWDLQFNVAIPIAGKENGDEDELDILVRKLADEKMNEPLNPIFLDEVAPESESEE